jgi:molybdopterin adenylyltransferase
MDAKPLDVMIDHLVLRELIEHLQQRPFVQNIDLMNTSGFCRNCLAKWRHHAMRKLNVAGATYEASLAEIYGMSYDEYKRKHQTKASDEQLALFKKTQENHARHEGFDPSSVPTVVPLSSVCCEPVETEEVVCTPRPISATESTITGLNMTIRIAVVTISDRASKGIYHDLSGPAIVDAISLARSAVLVIGENMLIEDDQIKIEESLRHLATSHDIILTTGGTGLGKRDVTPEATKNVIERTIPGISEMLRREGSKIEPMSWLSRGIAGSHGKCAIINLPGHPKGASSGTALVIPLFPRIVQLLRDA